MPKYYTTIQGWCDFEEIYKGALDRCETGRFLELGTWLGQSTCYMAEIIKESGKNIKFYGVDNFTGSKEDTFQTNIVANLGKTIYFEFLNNMKKGEVLDYVTPLVGTSELISPLFEDKSLDFIFIDANHEYEEVKKDLTLWFPKLKAGGRMGGHDYWMSGVERAVNEFFEQYKIPPFKVGNSWVIDHNKL